MTYIRLALGFLVLVKGASLLVDGASYLAAAVVRVRSLPEDQGKGLVAALVALRERNSLVVRSGGHGGQDGG